MKKQNPFSLSFEFFPPKSAEGMSQLSETASKLAKLNPAFFSVTFGAGGSTREGTLLTTQMLQGSTPIPVAPHLSCMGSMRTELTDILKTYQSIGTNRIVALRGDLPSGMGQHGELRYAHELVTLIRETTGDELHIEVAAYPEFHPQAKSPLEDILNLKRKIQAGANGAITQYFYSTDAYFYFIDECAKQGIHVPIVPGIMPITQFQRLARFSNICGAEIPIWIKKRCEGYGDDIDSVNAFGLEFIHDFCSKLIAGGAPGLHFYTLNQSASCIDIVSKLNIESQILNTNFLSHTL